MTAANPDLERALKLSEIIGGVFLQQEFGYFVTGLQGSVNYRGAPEAQAEVQKRLNELVKRMAIVYLFAIFDDYFTGSMKALIEPDNKERLRAFRHIRNSAAHGQAFGRAPDCLWRSAFDNVMGSDNPINGVTFDNDTIDLTASGAELQCRDLMAKITQQVLQPLYNQ